MWTSLFKQGGLSQIESTPVRSSIEALPSWEPMLDGVAEEVIHEDSKEFSGERIAYAKVLKCKYALHIQETENTRETGIW